MDFTDKVVLITGASSGIGAATAIHFSKLDASLSITGRNVNNLNKISEKCTVKSKKPLTITADLDQEKDVAMIIEKTIQKYGKLDVLVNNAAILELGSIESTSLDQYDRIMRTNVRSVYHLTMLAVPHLIKSQGNIVNVSSVAGFRSYEGALPYCMSKAALDHFTRCTALGLAAKKIRVNSVNPGAVVTSILKRAGLDDATYKAFVEGCKKTHPLGGIGQPEEVAEAIAFLASNAASNITGVSLTVDGGNHIVTPH